MSIYNRYRALSNQGDTKEVEVETGLLHRSRIRRAERFLKGPILMREIAAPAKLPGQALALLLAIHHRTALTGKAIVTLPASLLNELGISRDAKARGFKVLEQAGLIEVIRSKGCTAKVRLTNKKQDKKGGTNVVHTAVHQV